MSFLRRPILPLFLLGLSTFIQAQDRLQLAPPLIRCDSIFFSDTAHAELIFGMPDATLKFELQFGNVKFTNQTYTAPIKIHRSATLYYWATHPDYKSSKIQEAHFFQRSKAQFTVLDMTAPSALHPGNGPLSLSDNQKAEKRITAAEWLGFSDSLVVIRIAPENWPLEALVLSTLEHQEASVFLPKRVEVEAIDHKGNITAFPTIVMEPEIRNPGPSYQLIELLPPQVELDKDFDKLLRKGGHLEIRIYPIRHPKWHQEEGNPTWFFLDEIFAY